MASMFEKGVGLSILTYLIYESLSPELKNSIKKMFNIHHGEAGTIATIIGTMSNDPHLTGIGAGLMLTDLQDKDKWFN